MTDIKIGDRIILRGWGLGGVRLWMVGQPATIIGLGRKRAVCTFPGDTGTYRIALAQLRAGKAAD